MLYNEHNPQLNTLINGELHNKQVLKSRLTKMMVDYNPNESHKEYYVNLYNSAILSESNRNRIMDELHSDFEQLKYQHEKKRNRNDRGDSIGERQYGSERSVLTNEHNTRKFGKFEDHAGSETGNKLVCSVCSTTQLIKDRESKPDLGVHSSSRVVDDSKDSKSPTARIYTSANQFSSLGVSNKGLTYANFNYNLTNNSGSANEVTPGNEPNKNLKSVKSNDNLQAQQTYPFQSKASTSSIKLKADGTLVNNLNKSNVNVTSSFVRSGSVTNPIVYARESNKSLGNITGSSSNLVNLGPKGGPRESLISVKIQRKDTETNNKEMNRAFNLVNRDSNLNVSQPIVRSSTISFTKIDLENPNRTASRDISPRQSFMKVDLTNEAKPFTLLHNETRFEGAGKLILVAMGIVALGLTTLLVYNKDEVLKYFNVTYADFVPSNNMIENLKLVLDPEFWKNNWQVIAAIVGGLLLLYPLSKLVNRGSAWEIFSKIKSNCYWPAENVFTAEMIAERVIEENVSVENFNLNIWPVLYKYLENDQDMVKLQIDGTNQEAWIRREYL